MQALIFFIALFGVFSSVTFAAPGVTVQENQPEPELVLTEFSSQYMYMPLYEQHYIGTKDGLLDYAYHYTEGLNEHFDFSTTVPGGILQGGSLTVEMHGITSGKSYSFDLQNISWDISQGFQYRNRDAVKGVDINISPNGDGDMVSITKYASDVKGTIYYDGEWHPMDTLDGEFAFDEEQAMVYTIKLTNNLGQTYVKSGTIVLEYTPTQFDDQWDWQNYSNHSWGCNNQYLGSLWSSN